MDIVRLKQLAQNGAENNNIVRYDSSSGLWTPGYEFISAPTSNNKAMTPNTTSGDGFSTGLTITNTPDGYWVGIKVNGILYELGDGVTTKDGYFSVDGSSVRNITEIVVGDTFYWNGDIAGFDLDANDKVDFEYEVTTAGGPVVASGGSGGFELIEYKYFDTSTTSYTFEGLDGDSDEIYYLTYNIKNNNSNNVNYILNINGNNSNFTGLYTRGAYQTSVYYCNNRADISFSLGSGYSPFNFGDLYLFAKRDNESESFFRQGFGHNTYYNNNNHQYDQRRYCFTYNDSTTNITSLKFDNKGYYDGITRSNAIGSGSEMALYKMVR